MSKTPVTKTGRFGHGVGRFLNVLRKALVKGGLDEGQFDTALKFAKSGARRTPVKFGPRLKSKLVSIISEPGSKAVIINTRKGVTIHRFESYQSLLKCASNAGAAWKEIHRTPSHRR